MEIIMMPIQSIVVGHSARIGMARTAVMAGQSAAALDLVNTLDERPFDSAVENLATYRDLVRFAELARLIEPSLAALLRNLDGPACSRVTRRARQLREHLHRILAAARSGRAARRLDVDAISAAIQAAHAARVLVTSPSSRLAGHR
jgi:predicted RNA-binding Zn ribbon-like protein